MKIKQLIILISALVLVLTPIPALAFAKSNALRSFTIQAKQFEYSPAIIRVQQGDRVKITLEAEDVTHGLFLDAYGVTLEASPHQEKESSVEFVADRTGTFRFHCSITCGPMHPFMTGEFIVDPNPMFPFAVGLALLVTLGTVGVVALRKEHLSETPPGSWRFDLTRFAWLKWFLKQRWFQYAIILPNVFFFVIILLAAFFGTPVGNANFAIIFVWIVWWVVLIALLLPLGGRVWCAMCPLPAPGEWMDRHSFIRKGLERPLSVAAKLWPKGLKNIWLQNVSFIAVALFSGIILTRPLVTGIVLSLFIVAAIVFSRVFGKRIFCRYVCPVGGFIGLYSMVAPVEVRVKDPEVCLHHTEKECIRGSVSGYGCPWLEYPGNLLRNTYCGLCMECLKTCTKDNVVVNVRPFGTDLFVSKGRGLDEAYKAFIMLTCAAVYSAVFLGTWGFLKDWVNMNGILEFLLYAVLFLASNLVFVPGLYYLAVWAGKTFAEGKSPSRAETLSVLEPLRSALSQFPNLVRRGLRRPIVQLKGDPFRFQSQNTVESGAQGLPPLKLLFVDYAYALVPMGLAGWIAFSFSFLMVNVSYSIPLLSDPFGWGWDLFGTAHYAWTPYFPEWIPYIQTPILLVGLALSIATAFRIARPLARDNAMAVRSVAPVALFLLVITTVFLQLYL